MDVPVTDATKHQLLEALGVMVDALDKPAERKSARRHGKKVIPQSFIPEFLEKRRVWGITLQLYELRSRRNWGIGDFEDLIEMIGLAGSLRADFIGLNPLHGNGGGSGNGGGKSNSGNGGSKSNSGKGGK